MAQAGRDQNDVPTLIALSSSDGVTPVTLWADPITHRLLVDLSSGSGTVTSVSVVTANGFAGTVATANTTPAITLTTTITGIIKGNGTAISAASDGSDYLSSTTGLKLDQTSQQTITTNSPIFGALTASQLVATDANKALQSLAVATYPSLAELAFVKGVTSAIQTQLNAKGAGTVTNTGGSLTSNAVVLGAGTNDTKVSTGITSDGTAKLILGVNTATLGTVKMFGNTSGDVTVQPAAVAGTATVQTLPATTGTLVNRVTTANGVSATNSDGALTVTLGAITPTTVNGNTFTTGSSTYTGTAAQTYTFPTTTATIARTDAANTFTGAQTFSNALIYTNNAITASGNAATVPITAKLNTVTNNSAATLTITMTTTSATDGQLTIVRILDSSAAAQTIAWVNTEDSTVAAPTTSNGSTTLFLTVGFIYNGGTTKWRCIAKA